MGTIIITVEGGIAQPADPQHDDVYILDFDAESWAYDDAEGMIRAVLDSDLDGPQQMELIGRIADACLKDWA